MKIRMKPYFIGGVLVISFLTYVIIDMASYAEYTPKLYIDIMFSIVTVILSVAIAISAILQTVISHRNIKLQLFDKRYKVFETIVSATKVISEQNYSNYILSIGLEDPNFINKKVIESKDNLHDAAVLSQALFDKELSLKIFKAYHKYEKLVDLHFDTIKQHIALRRNEEFVKLYELLLLSTSDEDKAKYNAELNKVSPTFQPQNAHFNAEVEHFKEWIEESKLYDAFDKYLVVRNVDDI